MFPFSITYQLSKKDFLHLSFARRYREWSAILASVLGVMLFIYGLIEGQRSQLVVGSLAIFISPILLILRTLLIFRRFPYLNRTMVYEFTEDFLFLQREGIDTKVQWEQFKKTKTVSGFIILQLTTHEGVILPVNRFRPDQLAEIRKRINRD